MPSLKEIKKDLTKEKAPLNSEWVQVGSKRKSESKGKAKGKENKPPSRTRATRVTTVGPGLESTKPNSFSVLQGMEAQVEDAVDFDWGVKAWA